MYGQSLLLARRLVEAGVPVVQVNMGRVQTWDTHSANFKSLKSRLLPPTDQGVAALLDDLEARGMLDETLVVVTGEFGRTPRIGSSTGNANTRDGRDHWAAVFSAAFAGGGVRRRPDDRPVRPDGSLSGQPAIYAGRPGRDHLPCPRNRPGHRSFATGSDARSAFAPAKRSRLVHRLFDPSDRRRPRQTEEGIACPSSSKCDPNWPRR